MSADNVSTPSPNGFYVLRQPADSPDRADILAGPFTLATARLERDLAVKEGITSACVVLYRHDSDEGFTR
jgi:hypothetical protein